SADGRTPIKEGAANNRGRALLGDRVASYVLGGCLVLTLIPLFHILAYITFRGLGSVDWAFFTHLPQDEVPGLGQALLGRPIMVGLATLASGPVGILAALFLTEFRNNRLAPVVRFVGELLTGVPSVIVGVFAYALIVAPFGFSAYAGAFALAVLMV